MARGREFQIVGTATAKLREPKHLRLRVVWLAVLVVNIWQWPVAVLAAGGRVGDQTKVALQASGGDLYHTSAFLPVSNRFVITSVMRIVLY